MVKVDINNLDSYKMGINKEVKDYLVSLNSNFATQIYYVEWYKENTLWVHYQLPKGTPFSSKYMGQERLDITNDIKLKALLGKIKPNFEDWKNSLIALFLQDNKERIIEEIVNNKKLYISLLNAKHLYILEWQGLKFRVVDLLIKNNQLDIICNQE